MEALNWMMEHWFVTAILTVAGIVMFLVLVSLIRCYIECWQDYPILAGIITAVMGAAAILVAIYWDFVAANWLSILVLTVAAGVVLFFLVGFLLLYISLWLENKSQAIIATIILLLLSPAIIGFVMWVVSWDWVWIFYNMSTILLYGLAGLFVIAFFVGAITVGSGDGSSGGSGGSKPYQDKFNAEQAKNSQIFNAKQQGLIR